MFLKSPAIGVYLMVLSWVFDNLPDTQMVFDIDIDNLCDPLKKIPQRQKPSLQLLK
jgi:hypothetical protein